MGRLIGAVTPGNLDENYFLEKAAAYFDDQVVIYRNRRVFGRGFDVCILIPEKGVLVVGLKGWREENILRAEGDALILKTVQGETAAAPQKQAGGYRFAMERYIRQNLGKSPPVFPVVCLPRVSLDFYRARRLDKALEEGRTFFKEDLADKAAFFRKLGQALGEAGRRPGSPSTKKPWRRFAAFWKPP